MSEEVTHEMIDALLHRYLLKRFGYPRPKATCRDQLPKHYQIKEKQDVKEPK